MNEEILNAFIENVMDAEVIDKENEQEVLSNFFILNELAIFEETFINGGGVEPLSKVMQSYIQYEMAPKLE